MPRRRPRPRWTGCWRGSGASVLLAGGSALAHLTLLLTQDPYDNLAILATAGQYVGTEDIDGVSCHHVTVVQHYFEFDLWIETGARPLLRKLVPSIVTTSPSDAKPASEALLKAKNVRLETTLSFSDWEVGAPLPADVFRFTPPPGTKRVERLLTAAGPEEADPRVGRSAPAIRVPLLDGSDFDLSSHRGRDVVVLEFWASWSSGSAERLPASARLAKDLAGKSVAFLALNVDDTERFARGVPGQEQDRPAGRGRRGGGHREKVRGSEAAAHGGHRRKRSRSGGLSRVAGGDRRRAASGD